MFDLSARLKGQFEERRTYGLVESSASLDDLGTGFAAIGP